MLNEIAKPIFKGITIYNFSPKFDVHLYIYTINSEEMMKNLKRISDFYTFTAKKKKNKIKKPQREAQFVEVCSPAFLLLEIIWQLKTQPSK